MIVQVHLPDEVGVVYEKRAKAHKITLSKILAGQLTLFVEVDSHDRVIVVDTRNRNRIERILSKGGHIKHATDLSQRIEALAALRIEGVNLEFSQPEKEQIVRRAKKNSITVEEEVRRVVDSMKWQFFDNLI